MTTAAESWHPQARAHRATSLSQIGRSAELSLSIGLRSPESLSAGDIADLLGNAFDEVRAESW